MSSGPDLSQEFDVISAPTVSAWTDQMQNENFFGKIMLDVMVLRVFVGKL